MRLPPFNVNVPLTVGETWNVIPDVLTIVRLLNVGFVDPLHVRAVVPTKLTVLVFAANAPLFVMSPRNSSVLPDGALSPPLFVTDPMTRRNFVLQSSVEAPLIVNVPFACVDPDNVSVPAPVKARLLYVVARTVCPVPVYVTVLVPAVKFPVCVQFPLMLMVPVPVVKESAPLPAIVLTLSDFPVTSKVSDDPTRLRIVALIVVPASGVFVTLLLDSILSSPYAGAVAMVCATFAA